MGQLAGRVVGKPATFQRGIALLSPVMLLGVVGAVIAALMLALAVQTKRLDWAKDRLEEVTQNFREYRTQVETAGRMAEERARARTEQDRLNKEAADAEAEKTIAELRANIKRLRNERAKSARSPVPPAPAGAPSPERAHFDRAQLERAIGEFVAEAQRIADRGSEAELKLNAAKRWAQNQ